MFRLKETDQGAFEKIKKYLLEHRNSLLFVMCINNTNNSRDAYENTVAELNIRSKDASGCYRRITDDCELGLSAVKFLPRIIQHLSRRLKTNQKFIKDCIRLNGRSYLFLPLIEQREYDNVILVIKSWPYVFRLLSNRYKDDTWLAEMAIKGKISNVKYISERLSHDRGLAIMVSKMSYEYFKYFQYKFLNDREIVMNLARRKGFKLDDMPYHMKNDAMIISRANKRK